MLPKQVAKVLATRSAARVAVVIHHTATGKALVNLRIEIVAVGENQEGEVTAKLAMHLARKKKHRIALPRPLGMPEDAKLPLALSALHNRLKGTVHPKKLMVAGNNLFRLTRRVIKSDKVLQEIHKIALLAQPPAHARQAASTHENAPTCW